MTFQEEQNHLKLKFNELRQKTKISEGNSFMGRTMAATSCEIAKSESQISLALKITNFMDDSINDVILQKLQDSVKLNEGPSSIRSHTKEVYSAVDNFPWCSFICSLQVNTSVRLVIRPLCNNYGQTQFTMGFIPLHVPTDDTLSGILNTMPLEQGFWRNQILQEEPVEIYVTDGEFLVRGLMFAVGSRAAVHVDVCKFNNLLDPNPTVSSPV